MMTTVTIQTDLDPAEVGKQVARLRRVRLAPAERPQVPYEHHRLFREPVYTDGQIYARDEDDDMGG
jgi:hypothetical protein